MAVLREGVDFQGDHVVVTGAGAGIGRQLAVEFGALGASVSILDRSVNPRDEFVPTHELIQENGGDAEFFRCDLREAAAVERTMERIREAGPEVDILVNNAGVNRIGTVEEISIVDWDAVQDVNVRGAMLATKHCLDGLHKTEGCIVNVASIAGLRGSGGYASYGPSKAALINHTKQIAVDYGAEGIRANAVAPGFIEVGMGLDELDDPERAAAKREHTVLDRFGRGEDVVDAVVFLASDAAGFVTGETLVVDGGWTT